MTSFAQRPDAAKSHSLRSTLVATPEFWGAVAIAFMWLAVLFASIYGGDLVSVNGDGTQSTTTIPSGIFVAFFASLASIAVARRAFRRDSSSSDRSDRRER